MWYLNLKYAGEEKTKVPGDEPCIFSELLNRIVTVSAFILLIFVYPLSPDEMDTAVWGRGWSRCTQPGDGAVEKSGYCGHQMTKEKLPEHEQCSQRLMNFFLDEAVKLWTEQPKVEFATAKVLSNCAVYTLDKLTQLWQYDTARRKHSHRQPHIKNWRI